MFDVLTIAAVADELTATILDGKIQRVGLTTWRTLAMEVYAGGRRRWVIASADDRDPRLLLSSVEPAIDTAAVTPFLLLLRKYARGGVLIGVENPPLERVVTLSIAKRVRLRRGREDDIEEPEPEPTFDPDDPDPDEIYGVESPTFTRLHVEIMGRHSNLILVDDDGRVMESAKRVNARMSRVRQVAPRLPYVPPPPIDRPDPRRATAESVRYALLAAPATGDLAGWLVRAYRGLSPQMAREVAFLAAGDAGATLDLLRGDAAGEVARGMRRMLEPLATAAWSPRVYRDEDGEAVAFAAVPMTHLAARFSEETLVSMSAAAEVVSNGGLEAPGRHGARRERLVVAVREARGKVAARLGSLEDEQKRAASLERYREWGDAIYAYLWSIRPGQEALEVDGLTIPLDPRLSGKENAQSYFEQYRKGRNAGEHLPALIEKAQIEIDYLDQLATQVGQAESFAEWETLQAEWERYRVTSGLAGRDIKTKPRKTPARPRIKPLYDDDGNAVFVGLSGPQNDEVTFDVAGPNDTWLHARGLPGSHVIIRWRLPTAEEREETVLAAARLAAHYSGGRSGANVEVDVARRRHVRKIKGAGPGMVTYRNERTIAVKPGDEGAVRATLDIAGI